MTPDSELLSRYARTRSEDAFAELVRRHVHLIYSAAFRQVNDDTHLAQDVAQTVFTDLARKASSLTRRESLTGWLYTSTRFAAMKMARTENRRRNREDKFMREPTIEGGAGVSPAQTSPETEWENVRPALDDAMHSLNESDREAVLLRYFENQPFAEIGTRFGLGENAARMRVERALDKLRVIFAKRGITPATALASVISAHAVQMAPAGLATTLATTSIAAAGTGTAVSILKIMTATQFKLGIGVLVVAGATTAMVVQYNTQIRLRGESESLRQQIAQLETDNQGLSNRLAAVGQADSLTDEQMNELLKLRGEVGALREQASELKKLREQIVIHPRTGNVPAQWVVQENARMNDAMILCRSMQQYVLQFGRQPTNFDQLKAFIRTPPSEVSHFEIVPEPTLANLPYPEIIIVLREKESRQVSNGKLWERIYGFADGNIKQITSEGRNFAAWEQQHVVPQANQ